VANSFRKTALMQTITSLEAVSSLRSIHLRPVSFEFVNEFPVALVGVGQDERADYVNIGPGIDKEIIGVIEMDLITNQAHEEELIYDLLDLVDEVEVQIETDVATFRGLTPAVYINSPVHLDEDPIIDMERELTAVRCRFTYHNGL